jgi:hypothetical protein
MQIASSQITEDCLGLIPQLRQARAADPQRRIEIAHLGEHHAPDRVRPP